LTAKSAKDSRRTERKLAKASQCITLGSLPACNFVREPAN
jgi:hypothetical protein